MMRRTNFVCMYKCFHIFSYTGFMANKWLFEIECQRRNYIIFVISFVIIIHYIPATLLEIYEAQNYLSRSRRNGRNF